MADKIASPTIYESMLQAMVAAVPSVLLYVDNTDEVQHVFITNQEPRTENCLQGKQFIKLVTKMFTAENAERIIDKYHQCLVSQQPCYLNNFTHTTFHKLEEHAEWFFIPRKDGEETEISQGTVIFIKNCTEAYLMNEEFMAVTDQHKAATQELYAALANLDFQLMDMEQSHKKLVALHKITAIVQKTVNEKEVLSSILDGMNDELGYSHIIIFLWDKQTKSLTLKAQRGYSKAVIANDVVIPFQQGLSGAAAYQKELIYVADVHKDSRYIQLSPEVQSEVNIPLIVDEQLIGVLSLGLDNGKIIQPYDLDLLRSLASQIAITIAHANRVSLAYTQATTDGLTGLYNYRHFCTLLEQEVKRAKRYNRSLSMLMIDLDYFKNYNDTNGHRRGDEVLAAVADCIRQCCREVDYPIRYGGEEFAVLLGETVPSEAHVTAERIRKTIASYEFYNAQSQPGGALTVSIGVAGYPEHASTEIELLDAADAALYIAKRDKNRTTMYSSDVIDKETMENLKETLKLERTK